LPTNRPQVPNFSSGVGYMTGHPKPYHLFAAYNFFDQEYSFAIHGNPGRHWQHGQLQPGHACHS
jgi:hypothetical protein